MSCMHSIYQGMSQCFSLCKSNLETLCLAIQTIPESLGCPKILLHEQPQVPLNLLSEACERIQFRDKYKRVPLNLPLALALSYPPLNLLSKGCERIQLRDKYKYKQMPLNSYPPLNRVLSLIIQLRHSPLYRKRTQLGPKPQPGPCKKKKM